MKNHSKEQNPEKSINMKIFSNLQVGKCKTAAALLTHPFGQSSRDQIMSSVGDTGKNSNSQFPGGNDNWYNRVDSTC